MLYNPQVCRSPESRLGDYWRGMSVVFDTFSLSCLELAVLQVTIFFKHDIRF